MTYIVTYRTIIYIVLETYCTLTACHVQYNPATAYHAAYMHDSFDCVRIAYASRYVVL